MCPGRPFCSMRSSPHRPALSWECVVRGPAEKARVSKWATPRGGRLNPKEGRTPSPKLFPGKGCALCPSPPSQRDAEVKGFVILRTSVTVPLPC